MDPAVIFPDAVAVTIGYLTAQIPHYRTAVPVVKDIPDTRPPTFVRVLRTGGPRHNRVVDGAQLTVECWAPTDAAAYDLAAIVRALLTAVRSDRIAGTTVYAYSELGGPDDLPDPFSNQSRVTWSVTALVRGTDLQPVT